MNACLFAAPSINLLLNEVVLGHLVELQLKTTQQRLGVPLEPVNVDQIEQR